MSSSVPLQFVYIYLRLPTDLQKMVIDFVPSKKDIITRALSEYHKTFFNIQKDTPCEVRLIGFKQGVLYAEVAGSWKWKSLLDIGCVAESQDGDTPKQ